MRQSIGSRIKTTNNNLDQASDRSSSLPSHIMQLPLTAVLVTSLTINASTGIFFFLAPTTVFIFSKCDNQLSRRLSKLYEEKSSVVRKLCRDQTFSILHLCCGLYCISSKVTFDKPLHDTPSNFLFIFCVYLGNYIFKFFQDLFLKSKLPLYKINLLHHFVTASTFSVLVTYRQNAILGVIGLLFEGSVLIFDFCTLVRLLGANKNGIFFLNISIVRFVVTILLRAVCPIALLALTLSRNSPLSLGYVPLGFFFMNVVFFSMINGWHMKASFDSLKKRLLAWRLTYYYSRPEENIGHNGTELNNFTTPSQSIARPALPVIIPTDNNFRLCSPVSNVNMNSEEISNIAVSRRERTLPQISAIINDNFVVDGPIEQV